MMDGLRQGKALPLRVDKVASATLSSLRVTFSSANYILLRKNPRPAGKAGGYDYSLADGFWFV